MLYTSWANSVEVSAQKLATCIFPINISKAIYFMLENWRGNENVDSWLQICYCKYIDCIMYYEPQQEIISQETLIKDGRISKRAIGQESWTTYSASSSEREWSWSIYRFNNWTFWRYGIIQERSSNQKGRTAKERNHRCESTYSSHQGQR